MSNDMVSDGRDTRAASDSRTGPDAHTGLRTLARILVRHHISCQGR